MSKIRLLEREREKKINSIQKALIIPQVEILLWSWRARKIIIHKVKRTIQQTQHLQKKSYFNHSYSYKYRTIVTSS